MEPLLYIYVYKKKAQEMNGMHIRCCFPFFAMKKKFSKKIKKVSAGEGGRKKKIKSKVSEWLIAGNINSVDDEKCK